MHCDGPEGQNPSSCPFYAPQLPSPVPSACPATPFPGPPVPLHHLHVPESTPNLTGQGISEEKRHGASLAAVLPMTMHGRRPLHGRNPDSQPARPLCTETPATDEEGIGPGTSGRYPVNGSVMPGDPMCQAHRRSLGLAAGSSEGKSSPLVSHLDKTVSL